MFISDCLSINEAGHLTIGGADTISIAKTFGTPLYVMDEATVRNSLCAYKKALNQLYNGNGIVAYASKAFCCKEIYRIVNSEDCYVDVVSMGELYTALKAGFPAEKIFYHGNNKTVSELVVAVQRNVGRIVVDNLVELEQLCAVARSQSKRVEVLLRIKPGVDAHTHDFVRTGQIDSKFGFALETGEAMKALQSAITEQSVEVKGIHCHIGSQIFDTEPFELAAEVMLGLMSEVHKQTGHLMTELNLGGGYGISYTEEHDPVSSFAHMEHVSNAIHTCCARLAFPLPRIIIEPGRSVVGPAGITLYSVGTVKEIPGVRTYVSVDGGMTDNPRYMFYGSQYNVMVANRANDPKSASVTIAGRCCESGDLIGEHMPIQPPKVGDIIAVLATGAYNYSMASNYNRMTRPAVVMVRDGATRLIVRAEELDDLVKNDI